MEKHMNLSETVALIEEQFPGWTWLVRNDERVGAFAHIHRAGMLFGEDYIEGVTSFPVYANTAELALGQALEAAKSSLLIA